MELIRNRGNIPLITVSTDTVKLSSITAGKYDSAYITWAQQAKAYGHPFFFRFDWEMNGGWYTWGTTSSSKNTPADYVAAWRHVHDIFTQYGATNVTWVWCVNTEFPGSAPIDQLYPGDNYVDWTSIDGYNKSSATFWQSFSNLFTATYNHILQFAPNKPIMIAETATHEIGGSKANWITDALTVQVPLHFPKIKALLWFNWRIFENGAYQDWNIESSASSQQAFHDGISSPYYMPGGGFGNLPLLTKIDPLLPNAGSCIATATVAVTVNICTGIETFEDGSRVTIYPNPTTSETIISYSLSENSSVKIIAYDALGREVIKISEEKQMPGTHQLNFNVENLQSGLYFIKTTIEGREVTRKLIVNKN